MGGAKPTAELLAEVEKLLREGGTANSIGAAVGRSRGSIVGLVHRHLAHVGFKRAPDGRLRIGKIRAARAREAAKVNIEVVDEMPEPAPQPVSLKPPQPIETLPEPRVAPNGHVYLQDLREVHCRWPMWDDGAKLDDKYFCGAAVARGRYCAKHAAKMFSAPHPRR